MTGKDSVLNRRIASIFINELENHKKLLKDFSSENLQELEFAIHKIRPSLVIFEMEHLLNPYEMIISSWKESNDENASSELIDGLTNEIDASIAKLRLFISGNV